MPDEVRLGQGAIVVKDLIIAFAIAQDQADLRADFKFLYQFLVFRKCGIEVDADVMSREGAFDLFIPLAVTHETVLAIFTFANHQRQGLLGLSSEHLCSGVTFYPAWP